METDLSGTAEAVSDSISTNEVHIDQLATDKDTLSSAISTQASTLDAGAVSLANYLDATEQALEADLETTMESLDAIMVNMDKALSGAGADRGVLSGIVSTARDTFDGQVADLKSVLMGDISKASPAVLSTSVSRGIATLEQAVKSAETSFKARLTQSAADVLDIDSKIAPAHRALSAGKTGLQVADLSLTQRVDTAETAVRNLAVEVAKADAQADAAETMLTAVSKAVHAVPNAAMLASLSKPIKQMASDVRVLKNWVTGEVGEYTPAATFSAAVRYVSLGLML